MSGIPCDCCGRFMSYAEMEPGGGAHFHFVPLNEFGPEEAEWTCKRCHTISQERTGGGLNKALPTNNE